MLNSAPKAMLASSGPDATTGSVRGWRSGLAFVIAVMMAFGGLLGLSANPAFAAVPGFTVNVNLGDKEYDGTTILTEGQTLAMNIGYSQEVGAGTVVPIKLGEHFTLGDVPAGNSAVESITVDPSDPNLVLVKFADKWPDGISQGSFKLNFTVKSVEKSSEETITWEVGGEETSQDIIIKNEGDDFASVTDNTAKQVTNHGNLSNFVKFDPVTGGVVVGAGIIGAPVSYKLLVDTNTAQTGYSIADTLPTGMAYAPGSFKATQTSWDANGLNKKIDNNLGFAPTITSNTFVGTLDLPGPSKTEITYTASIADEAGRKALENLLNEAAEGKLVGEKFTVSLINAATFGPGNKTHEGKIDVGGTVVDLPGPNPNAAFSKDAVKSLENVNPAEDGTLDPPVEVTFKLKADLSSWDGTNPKKTLTSNVVLTDKLPAPAVWKTGDDFLTATGIVLTEAPGPVNLADFAGNSYVGKYFVDGQNLYINLGQDKTLKAEILVKATISTINGITSTPGTKPGDTNYKLTNKATWEYSDIGPNVTVNKNKEITLVEHIPVPDTTKAFAKNADWDLKNTVSASDGTLTPALDIVYTLKTDLSQWDGSNVNKTLTSNVVLTDKLPAPATWGTGDDFLTATGITLTKATDPVDLAAFADDAYKGKYFVDGQNLYINLGKDNALVAEIQVKATLGTLKGMTPAPTSTPGESLYKLTNEAVWSYEANGKKAPKANDPVDIVDFQGNDEGFNSDKHFKKDSAPKSVTIKPGETTTVNYTFTVVAGQGVDVTKSKIVDYVDSNLLDVTDLDAIKEKITAKYDGAVDLGPSDFNLEFDAKKNLVITLNEAGVAKANVRGNDKKFVINLPLETVASEVKQTVTIKNKATLFGSDDKALYWSETSSESTSYGDEAEIRKTVRDTPNEEWTQNLRAEVNDGVLVQDHFVYNIALIPRGSYDGTPIFDVSDKLPAGVEFVGFVADTNVDDHAAPQTGIQDLKANVQARFEPIADGAPSGTVVLFQKPGTVLKASDGAPSVNVLVRITDFTLDEPIVNTVEGTSANITPSDGYPLAIAKIDSANPETIINDSDARFEILNELGDVVVRDVFVKDGALRVLGKDGEAKAVTVEQTGTYTIREITPPAGYELSEKTIEVVVGRDGTSDAVTFVNDPVKTFAVGDIVWVDSNNDGQQGETEFLQGVTVALLDGEGKAVLDGEGNPVVTTTDENGRYLFDELFAGEYQVKFELTAEQQKKYRFTSANVGEDASDSDADQETGLTVKFILDGSNTALTKEYDREFKASEGIDPTWDAGVVLKPKVSVGDYVWVDTNRDGIQDEDEKGIKDVVLELTGPDGKPVTDVFGDPVKPTKTDKNGAYTFENLPVLKDGESYTVKIDREASTKPLAPYIPTIETEGNRGKDSSTWTATSEGLTEDGQRDPSLDFGFVLPKVSVGDYVWVDSDKDGRQDKGEPGIPGVVLELTGPDGKPVTDVFGKPVKPTKTDKNGAYTFENLPVLKDGESYTVTINKKKSKKALKGYVPTKSGQGDREGDSSKWTASSKGLNNDGDRDPTLDFGFVLEPVDPETPENPELPGGDDEDGGSDGATPGDDEPSNPGDEESTTPEDGLAITGFTALGIGAAGLMLLAAGLLLVRRRKLS